MTTSRDENLAVVRHQLDSLSFARSMGAMTQADKVLYEELCDKEAALLYHQRRLQPA